MEERDNYTGLQEITEETSVGGTGSQGLKRGVECLRSQVALFVLIGLLASIADIVLTVLWKKKVEPALLPVDGSEDESEFSSDEDKELQANLIGESESDEDYEPENEDEDEDENEDEDSTSSPAAKSVPRSLHLEAQPGPTSTGDHPGRKENYHQCSPSPNAGILPHHPFPGTPLESAALTLKLNSVHGRYIQLCEDYTDLGQSCSKKGKRTKIKHTVHLILFPSCFLFLFRLHVEDTCYYFSNDMLDWLKSRDSCTMSSHLTILHTMEQHANIGMSGAHGEDCATSDSHAKTWFDVPCDHIYKRTCQMDTIQFN
ncbi:LOW QUALITY PROTEIN: uncharacterized protein cldc1 [Diretmus argenteus]